MNTIDGDVSIDELIECLNLCFGSAGTYRIINARLVILKDTERLPMSTQFFETPSDVPLQSNTNGFISLSGTARRRS